MISIKDIIQQFNLLPHPEGGYYTRTYFDEQARFSSILYALEKGDFSSFHRIQQDEQWNFYHGNPLVIHEINQQGNYKTTHLSLNTQLQYVVKADHWFAVTTVGNDGFSLCGCTVIPAFSFDTFELATCQKLTAAFPQHADIIQQLTRS